MRGLPLDSEAVNRIPLKSKDLNARKSSFRVRAGTFYRSFVPKLIFRKIFFSDMARSDWNRLVLIRNEISDGNQRNPRSLDGILAESFSDMVNQNVTVFTYKNLTRLSIRKSKKYSFVLLPGL